MAGATRQPGHCSPALPVLPHQQPTDRADRGGKEEPGKATEATMALAGALERLQEEAICPICLEYMSEPVSIDCGHNFCRGCIAKHCQEKGLWADGPFSCPQCRASCHRSGFRPNRQLANIVESIRQLGLRAGQGTEPATGTLLCPQHDERLKFFCEEDEEAICVVCRESLHHRPHTVYPIEEAAQVYKVGEVGVPHHALMHPGHRGISRQDPTAPFPTALAALPGQQRRGGRDGHLGGVVQSY